MVKNENPDKLNRALTIIGWILCIVLVPILIVNCTLLIKSFVNREEVPDFGGTIPLIVLTDSMDPDIKSGDLIICKTVDTDQIEIDDVISFFDPAGNGTAIVTHKVIDIIEEDGVRYFRTKGINNNTEDRLSVREDRVVAEYTGVRFGGIGHVAIFMQSTTGFLLCIALPIILFVGYDVIRRRRYEKTKDGDVAALMAELEALKAAKAAQDAESQKDTAPEDITDSE